jgi:hypothetical protein
LPGKGKAPELGPQEPLPDNLVNLGPPAECTWQMQKELDQTVLKRLEEAKATEKKKKKDSEEEKKEEKKRQKALELFRKHK